MDIKHKRCRISEAFLLPFQKRREGLLFIIFQYVFKMFSLLAVLGQVIPGGSESPFLAARLCRCRAWNPITSAAMLALWHQTPSMQNATAGVYQQLAPQLSRCRGAHWWVTWLTRGRRDDTSDTDVGQNGEHRMKWGWGRQVDEGGGCKWLHLNIRARDAGDWQAMKGIREGGKGTIKSSSSRFGSPKLQKILCLLN